ncbi:MULTISPECIES: UDP-2,3-diacylglucosamine diphosphatase [Oleiagrimonas]|uniref:UDP-2,3-diacylglucosamine diphosphatase n=1 Tax=Oleiagrimonas citrea TaxID=1665687 RepID=A0A846ZJ08_9GAMM|nr:MULTISPECIES: UDP-2,3-diacylglucosamine diphosphatase [Oleiagrimonas]NKZ37558.1 UDP-2,3-diacylglucosamine diphosphatase [Oleiagrimonas citrea]RAP56127.1 UDP-2,3-diacylglucosamine hydrolase [Oleiagrimonas sp. MCCC 1A03011]
MSRTTFRSVFLSDVHLGTPDCKAAYLLDFLRTVRCEHLYLVGDIIDLEALGRRRWWHSDHSEVLLTLLDIARSGTRVTYIPGNHDAMLRGLAGESFGGIRIELEAEHVGADGRRYRVSHGDEFDPEHVGRRWMLWLGEALHRAICWTNRRLHAWRRRRAKPYLPLSIIIKSHIGRALAYIRAYEARVAQRAREEGFDGHICGHIHFGHVRRMDGVLYLNDGDWVEHCTALVEDQTGAMELLHWSEQATALGRASSEIVLPSPAAALALAPLTAMQRNLSQLHRAA